MAAIIPDTRFPADQENTKQTDIDLDSPECSTMTGVVRGRNDYDVPPPSMEGTPEFERECHLFIQAAVAYKEGLWPGGYFEALNLPAEPTDLARLFAIERRASRGDSVVFDDGVVWQELVNFVGMDSPLDFHLWLADNIQFDVTVERSPEECGFPFLKERWFDSTVARTIEAALVEAFQVKYFFRAGRPSSFFPAGRLVEVSPCPSHWRYVAGHGAFMGGTAATWRDTTDSDYSDQLMDTAMQMAHARTGLGVHFPEDNTQGVLLGEKVAGRLA